MSENRIKLPRVSPEGLVEGKWYVASLGRSTREICYFDGDVIWEAGDRLEWLPENVKDLFGPLPEFELEGE